MLFVDHLRFQVVNDLFVFDVSVAMCCGKENKCVVKIQHLTSQKHLTSHKSLCPRKRSSSKTTIYLSMHVYIFVTRVPLCLPTFLNNIIFVFKKYFIEELRIRATNFPFAIFDLQFSYNPMHN